MSYPQINTYPLTLGTAGNYAESLKTAKAAFTPRQSVFFMPMAWMRVGNIQYRPEPSLAAFSESTPLFCGILRRLKKMTTLSEVYGVYTNLRQIFNSYNPENYDKDTDEANTALCGAMNELEAAMAYIKIEGRSDRKLKLKLLKQSLSLAAERADGTIDLDNLSAAAREQLTMVLQLMGEEK